MYEADMLFTRLSSLFTYYWVINTDLYLSSLFTYYLVINTDLYLSSLFTYSATGLLTLIYIYI